MLSYISFIMNETQTYSIDELCALVGFSPRTIRFYIQQGLVEKPRGLKRGSYYDLLHLTQLLEIKRWQDAGLSLDRIRQLLRHAEEGSFVPDTPKAPGHIEVWSHIHLGHGLELAINPLDAGLSPEQVSHLASQVIQYIEQIKKKE